MKNIIFIAPPAAGKGTLSNLLQVNYDYDHISTGDMLREEIALESELGLRVKNIIESGQLVDDETITELLKNKLSKLTGKPFVLDGFPRTLNQAKSLKLLFEELNIDYCVISLEIDEQTAMERSLGRLTCSCGRSYNMYNDALKPKVENICDDCGNTLVKRNDDNEESFKVRFKTFLDNTAPIVDFYKELNKLYEVNVNDGSDIAFKNIEKVIQ